MLRLNPFKPMNPNKSQVPHCQHKEPEERDTKLEMNERERELKEVEESKKIV